MKPADIVKNKGIRRRYERGGLTKETARVGYYDRLRVLAMTAVILIHVCGSAATSLAADDGRH